MKKLLTITVISLLSLALQAKTAKAGAGKHASGQTAPLKLINTIPLPGVEGDFDHFGVDIAGNRLFLAAEEHKTVEVFNLRNGKHLRSIKGFGVPHSVLYLPAKNQLIVTDGEDGTCKMVDGKTYKIVGEVKLDKDADSIGYDPKANLLYVDNGGKDAGKDYSMISIVNTKTGKHEGDIKVESNRLEAMAIEHSGPRIFVNITGKGQIGVIDRNKRQLGATWDVPDAKENVPMALDEAGHRLFVVTRKPARFIVFDIDSGKVVATLPATGRSDDMSWDPVHKRVYSSGGEGFVDVFAQRDPDHYEAIAKVPTGPVAKISSFVPQLNRLYVAVSAKGAQQAKVMVFQVQ